MSTIVLPMASSPLKRTAADAELDLAPSNLEASMPHNNNVLSMKGQDAAHPDAPSISITATKGTDDNLPTNSSSACSAVHDTPAGQRLSPSKADATSITSNPAKRRKLTFAEKEALKIEKAHKELQKKEEMARKEEEKAKREEEKKAREEEKRAKDELKEAERKKKEEEKEEKRKAKEAEKAAKEEEKKKKEAEKRAKDDEKSKKERAQLRLNSFFTNPKPSSKGPDSPLRGENLIQSRRNSVASTSNSGSNPSTRASSMCPEPRKSDWEKCFPPFFLHAHTTLAPPNQSSRFKRLGAVERGLIVEQLDAVIMTSQPTSISIADALCTLPKRSRPRPIHLSTKEIVAQINGTSTHPIDPTKSSRDSSSVQLLRALPIKYLKYTEDVRPPYIGTYTRRPASLRSLSKICRKPCTSRVLPDVNYDYDSEVEWEEPGEGEDLDSEGELDDEGDDDADDMDGFVDDEGADLGRKRVFGGDMVPMQTGVCWDDGTREKKEVDFGEGKLDLRTMSIEGLMVDTVFPIDPFSTAYWPSTTTASTTFNSLIMGQSSTATMVPPSQPRLPLNAISTSASNLPFPHLPRASHDPSKLGLATTVTNAAVTKGTLAAAAGKPPKKPFPTELLPDLRKAVEGSDLTKAGLVEILKKKFPKVGKDAIHYTLGLIAERVGKNESEKKWVLK